MKTDDLIQKLEARGVKPTAIRLLILKAMLDSDHAVSLPELEGTLETVDKSSIFRTVMLFLSHHLIHGIADGSGMLKYAVCSDDCHCEANELHTHFYCEHCHRTFCLKRIHVPVVELPDGFLINSINYVIKGLCPECAEKEEGRKRRSF